MFAAVVVCIYSWQRGRGREKILVSLDDLTDWGRDMVAKEEWKG